MRIRAFLFDFDGVLMDTEQCWLESLMDFAGRHDLTIDEKELRSLLGFGDDGPLSILTEAIGGEDQMRKYRPELSRIFREKASRLRLKDGAGQYLDYADSQGILKCCVSSSEYDYYRTYASQIGILERMDATVTGDRVPKNRRKPFADLYNLALSELAVKPDEALAFEDSVAGARAAAAAGVPCVLIETEATGDQIRGLSNKKIRMTDESPEELIHECMAEKNRGRLVSA